MDFQGSLSPLPPTTLFSSFFLPPNVPIQHSPPPFQVLGKCPYSTAARTRRALIHHQGHHQSSSPYRAQVESDTASQELPWIPGKRSPAPSFSYAALNQKRLAIKVGESFLNRTHTAHLASEARIVLGEIKVLSGKEV